MPTTVIQLHPNTFTPSKITFGCQTQALPTMPPRAQLAVSHGIHWVRSSMNDHLHFDVSVVDGVLKVAVGDEKSKPSNCKRTSMNLTFVIDC